MFTKLSEAYARLSADSSSDDSKSSKNVSINGQSIGSKDKIDSTDSAEIEKIHSVDTIIPDFGSLGQSMSVDDAKSFYNSLFGASSISTSKKTAKTKNVQQQIPEQHPQQQQQRSQQVLVNEEDDNDSTTLATSSLVSNSPPRDTLPTIASGSTNGDNDFDSYNNRGGDGHDDDDDHIDIEMGGGGSRRSRRTSRRRNAANRSSSPMLSINNNFMSADKFQSSLEGGEEGKQVAGESLTFRLPCCSTRSISFFRTWCIKSHLNLTLTILEIVLTWIAILTGTCVVNSLCVCVCVCVCVDVELSSV